VSEPPRVAVVVPSWNTVDLLSNCLRSLSAQDLPLEIFVVDNGSSDGSLELLRREEVTHLALPRNVGFAAAVNLGVGRTSAPRVLVLNADTVVEGGAIETMAAALDDDRSLGGVQPRILQLTPDAGDSVDEARLYSAGQALTRDGRAVELGAGQPQVAGPRGQTEIFGVCGAACLLRREMFDQLGGYDERYFSFYEDVDLNVRARIAGWRFAYVPQAVVWHLGNAAWIAGAARPTAWNARLVARNRLATQAKFMPLRALSRIVAVEVGALLRAARQRRFGATLRGKLEGLRLLPGILGERRRLGEGGDLERARRWLGTAP
jgi:GT2 family glycosyltransferase